MRAKLAAKKFTLVICSGKPYYRIVDRKPLQIKPLRLKDIAFEGQLLAHLQKADEMIKQHV